MAKEEKKAVHKALAHPNNDQNFKMHVLEKLDHIDAKHDKLDRKFLIFKGQALIVIAMIVTAKEYFVKKIGL